MGILLEIILPALAEFFYQIILEFLFEVGLRSSANALGISKPTNPILAAVGYVILGFISAGISVLIFPHGFIKRENYIILNILVTPLLAGFVMKKWGEYLKKKSKNAIRLDSFIYGYIFALSLSGFRYLWTR